MTAHTYPTRLLAALRKRLPGDVTVTVDRVMVVFSRGTASAVIFTDSLDHRHALTDENVREYIERAAHKLRGEVPKYREEFRAPALALAEILDGAA